MGTWPFPRGKAAGVCHWPPTLIKRQGCRKSRAVSLLLLCVLMALCRVNLPLLILLCNYVILSPCASYGCGFGHKSLWTQTCVQFRGRPYFEKRFVMVTFFFLNFQLIFTVVQTFLVAVMSLYQNSLSPLYTTRVLKLVWYMPWHCCIACIRCQFMQSAASLCWFGVLYVSLIHCKTIMLVALCTAMDNGPSLLKVGGHIDRIRGCEIMFNVYETESRGWRSTWRENGCKKGWHICVII